MCVSGNPHLLHCQCHIFQSLSLVCGWLLSFQSMPSLFLLSKLGSLLGCQWLWGGSYWCPWVICAIWFSGPGHAMPSFLHIVQIILIYFIFVFKSFSFICSNYSTSFVQIIQLQLTIPHGLLGRINLSKLSSSVNVFCVWSQTSYSGDVTDTGRTNGPTEEYGKIKLDFHELWLT